MSPDPASPQAVLFDCDGTLANSLAGIHQAAAEAMAAEGLPPPDPAGLRQLIGLSVRDALATAVPEAPADQVLRLAHHFETALARVQASGIAEPLYPGIAALIEALAAQGRLLGVITGKSHRSLLRTLQANGIAGYFSVLRTPDHGPSKPNPWPIVDALGALGVAPENAVMIGDTSFDMLAARGAAVAAIGVGWGVHPLPILEETGAVAVARHADRLMALIDAQLGAPAA